MIVIKYRRLTILPSDLMPQVAHSSHRKKEFSLSQKRFSGHSVDALLAKYVTTTFFRGLGSL